ncbi:VanW family protein [Dactylosporangium sp. NPDC006015]|uniref:VanW family protein n=1 Tax=Dactylosporangium sp. NPDC006015 TaxID=3154576 RepID=UPI0033B33ED9
MATDLLSRLRRLAPTAPQDRPREGVVVPPIVRRARARRRRRLAATLTLVVVVPVVTAVSTYAKDVDRGVHVLGVDLGGHSRGEAVRLLRDTLRQRVTAPVAVRVGTAGATVDPAAVGLVLDVEATVERAVAATPGPFAWLHGGVSVAPVVRADATRLYEALMAHLGTQGDAPVLPAVRFDKQQPVAVYPVSGRGIDRHKVGAIMEAGWLRRGTVDFPVVDLVPRSTKADVDRLLGELATPAVAAPLVVATPRGEVAVPATAIAAALKLESDADGLIQPSLDVAALRKAVPAFGKVEVAATDATFTVERGRPVVRPQVDGQQADLVAASPAILAVLRTSATPRRVEVGLTAKPAAVTAAQLGALGVKEQLSTFTTKFVAGQPRVVNIRTMAEALRGAVVLPDQTFSLNGHVGQRTHAKGYVDAPGIEDGKIKNSPGGGVSQVATTLFNAVFHAGLQDVEHRPHTYWFDRYPSVIEATVVYPSLDLRFRNDSPTGVLIDTATTDTSVTVTLYGTKRYDIALEYGPRTKLVQPPTTYLRETDCNPTDGLPGFTQEAWRVFKQGGKELRRERFSWRYDPEPHFICGTAPVAPAG